MSIEARVLEITDSPESVVLHGPTEAEVVEANETHDYKKVGGLRKLGYSVLTAAITKLSLLTPALADNKAQESAPLPGLNQIHLMNIAPAGQEGLFATVDPRICDQAHQLQALFEKRGWPGWSPRFHPSSGGACEFDIVHLTISPESALQKMTTQQFSDDIKSHMNAANLNSREYFAGFLGDENLNSWFGSACDITNAAHNLDVKPGTSNFGVLVMAQNRPGCNGGMDADGFGVGAVNLVDIMFPNFGYSLNSNRNDILNPAAPAWGTLLFDYFGQVGYGPKIRQWPDSTWLVEKSVGGTGQGSITETIKDYTVEPALEYKNTPGHPLVADPGNRFVAGSDIIFSAKDQLGSHFKQWLVEAPDPSKGPNLPGRISNPYNPVAIPNPTSRTLEIDGLDRSYKIEAVFEKDAVKKRLLKIAVGRGGSVRGAGGILVSNGIRNKADVMRHNYPINSGQRVTLYEKPVPGHKFAGWYGACKGLVSKCVVLMNGDKTVGARFN